MTQLSAGAPLEPPAPSGGPALHAARRPRSRRSAARCRHLVPGARSGRRRPDGAHAVAVRVVPGRVVRVGRARSTIHPLGPASSRSSCSVTGAPGCASPIRWCARRLASRGAVVVSCDHPGDVLTDWLLGTHADDRTNEVNRVGDAHLLIHALVHGHPSIGVGVLNAVDHDRIVIMGHSYGAYTALATVAGARGVAAHDRVKAIVGFQPYTRTISDSLLGRVTTPTLFVVSELDRATPPDTDAERPWALVRGEPTWRLDLGGAGHQAISDIALYAELAAHVADLPDIVRQYLAEHRRRCRRARRDDVAGADAGAGVGRVGVPRRRARSRCRPRRRRGRRAGRDAGRAPPPSLNPHRTERDLLRRAPWHRSCDLRRWSSGHQGCAVVAQGQ